MTPAGTESTTTAAEPQSLTARTTDAIQWRFAASAVAAFSQLGISIVLARLLAPADFGVMALAMTIVGFARPIGDLGIGNAVVQRTSISDAVIRVAFTVSILLGAALAVLLSGPAPFCSTLLRNPQVTSVLRILAIGFAIQGTAVVSAALIRRRLDFKRLFFIDVGSYVIGFGGVAVTLALKGYGVSSLAYGSVVQTALASTAQTIAERHAARLLLRRRELSELLHFGFGGTAIALVNFLALNGDNFVVGRWSGASSLGLYARAYNLMNLPFVHVSSVMSSVFFPAFAQVQKETTRMRRAYLLLTQSVSMVAAPAMVTMGVAAPHLVRTLYGPQWTGVVAPLQILCLAGYFRALYHLGGIMAQSAGYVYNELRRQVVYTALVVVGTFVGLRYGLPGVAAGVSIAILFMFFATAQLCLRITATSWSLYMQAQRDAWVTTAVTLTVALLSRWLLEAGHVSSAGTTLGILTAAAIPWSIGILRVLSRPGFEPLLDRLPALVGRLAKAFQPAAETLG